MKIQKQVSHQYTKLSSNDKKGMSGDRSAIHHNYDLYSPQGLPGIHIPRDAGSLRVKRGDTKVINLGEIYSEFKTYIKSMPLPDLAANITLAHLRSIFHKFSINELRKSIKTPPKQS